jgi:single-stranded-DNA-specific exonuclease
VGNIDHQKQQPRTGTSSKLHPIIRDILISRGYETKEEIQEFLSWDLKALPNLGSLLDIQKASHRIIEAIKNDEKICVYGDYDVDGTTSCALLYHFFKMLGVTVELIQPSRFEEGYGLHLSSVDAAVNLNCKILITVDCGITSVEPAEYAKSRGVDLIITDHHADAAPDMPEAFAIINPNRRDEPEESLLRPLAGVGVAFALAVEIKKIWDAENTPLPSLYPLLEFVAIGTISDLARICPANAKLIRHGLKQIPKSIYPGVRQFLTPEERNKTFLDSEKVSFQIGPLINSKGRLDHPESSLKLLIAKDSTEANPYYNILKESNRERKIIQGQVFKEAKKQFLSQLEGDDLPPMVIVYSPEWHEGVIGIVASKLVEEFRIPAIVFTDAKDEGIIKASARTAGELDLFSLLNDNRDFFEKFGGHKAAAGLSMKKENLAALKDSLYQSLFEIPEILRTRALEFDVNIDFNQISPNLVYALQTLEPFGNHNARPTFKIHNFKIENFSELSGGHIRWDLAAKSGQSFKIKGISFSYVGRWNHASPEELMQLQLQGENLELIGQIGFNDFRGNRYLQILVSKIQTAL